VSAGASPRSFGVGVQIPNGPGIGLGEVGAIKPGQFARGPYVSLQMGLPFLKTLTADALTFNVGGALYYPPLHMVTEQMRTPAQWLASGKAAALHFIAGTFAHLRSGEERRGGQGGEAGHPTVEADHPATSPLHAATSAQPSAHAAVGRAQPRRRSPADHSAVARRNQSPRQGHAIPGRDEP
jgi:hypothetical protein